MQYDSTALARIRTSHYILLRFGALFGIKLVLFFSALNFGGCKTTILQPNSALLSSLIQAKGQCASLPPEVLRNKNNALEVGKDRGCFMHLERDKEAQALFPPVDILLADGRGFLRSFSEMDSNFPVLYGFIGSADRWVQIDPIVIEIINERLFCGGDRFLSASLVPWTAHGPNKVALYVECYGDSSFAVNSVGLVIDLMNGKCSGSARSELGPRTCEGAKRVR